MEQGTQAGAVKTAPQRHVLSTGVLELRIARADLDGLFRIAERQNPKRAFLFVSTVLGRHLPVCPLAHRDALARLAGKVRPLLLAGPVQVMGYAETAVGLGAGVYDCLRQALPDRAMGYLPTTRFPVSGGTPCFAITEAHSHAVDHTIMHPRPGVLHSGADATLVLVDDETTTGTTFRELAEGLAAHGLSYGRVILTTLTDWSDGAASAAVSPVFPGAQVQAVSLLDGSWSWRQDEAVRPPDLPPATNAQCPEWVATDDQPFASPRLGLGSADQTRGAELRGDLPAFAATDRVLVIGSGEHVWQPFLFAEAVASLGNETRFIATTRSPILPGPVIATKIVFPDHFGLGIDMYLHNVDPAEWDRIVLFTETGIRGIPAPLRRALGKGHIVDGQGRVFAMTEGTATEGTATEGTGP